MWYWGRLGVCGISWVSKWYLHQIEAPIRISGKRMLRRKRELRRLPALMSSWSLLKRRFPPGHPKELSLWIWELWLLMMILQAQIRTSSWDTSLLQPADAWDPPSMDLQALLPHCPAIRGSRGFVTFISKPGINVFSVRSLWVYFPLCAFRSYSF